MNQRLYGIWLGEVLFCFSGELSESKVDAWTAVLRRVELESGDRPFQHAVLRLAEIRFPYATLRKSPRTGERRSLIGRTLEGLTLPVEKAWQLLLGWDESAWEQRGFKPGAEMSYWSKAARFVLELLMRGRIAPSVRPSPVSGARRRGAQGQVQAVWGPLLTEPKDEERFRLLAGSMPPVCLAAVQSLPAEEGSTLEERQMVILHNFMTAMIDYETRGAVKDLGRKLNPARADYRRGYSPLAELWWNSLLTGGQPPDIQAVTAELASLTQEVAESGGMRPKAEDVEAEDERTDSLRLCLRLEPMFAEEGSTLQGNGVVEESRLSRMSAWRLSIWGEGVEEGSVLLPASLIWSYPASDMHIHGMLYRNVQETLLLRLSKAASLSGELADVMKIWRPEELILGPEVIYHFLSKSVPVLRKHGVTIQMPSKWTREGRRSVGIRIKAEGWASGSGETAIERTSKLGIEQLVTFEAEAMLGGQSVSREELAELAAAKHPLVFFRGEWIEVDVKEIRQVLKFMKRREDGTLLFRELMHLSAGEESVQFEGVDIEGVETSGMLSAFVSGSVVRHPDPRPVPQGLRGTLRPYQERGYQWLSAMRDLGFGALLADDMGLGKTIQVITVLLDRVNSSPGKSLIICPTSLLGNWQREIARFAPELRLYVHHGSNRHRGERFVQEYADGDVLLTTYQLAGRDAKELRSVEWSTVVLDEAQYIKNYGTKQAQSVMKLNAPHRIAMTGTPVENRLGELWSIFQFLNPGYLGTQASFRSRFASGVEQPSDELQKLRRLVAPFLLRRLKSDPDIRKDLPEKIELKSYCTLTTEQVRLYRSVTDELMGRIGEHEGMARKGLVLSSLTRLKQICNHPVLARGPLRPSESVASGRSGKMERLEELLDLIMDSREAVLIFTQYVRMGELLQERLTEQYGVRPFFLHGAVPKAERDEMVRSFQEGEGSPIFVLSLKAGGVGLNLTRANHVVHYDRWWNPAVENQATDRVFRIGQRKNVEVHKLICQGTLEERIDELIERKKSLSEQVVGSGEQWLTEMNDEELQSLIMLQEGSFGEPGGGYR
ncbi:DEAD/DEAH box helicase [Paenibacillus senegalimassiliensis]|uniref:DEAD/DEAH box helicase n=1 Tax=Paenibacillus senegalimassiliensis TaxID=1737426 RepID=UPI00073F88F0|nr:DEAD/DEAH box helicase [Paenibacillus senegalimassiliensis]